MRYIVGIGNCTVVSLCFAQRSALAASFTKWPTLRELAGTVDVNGLSGGLMNDGDSSAATISSVMAKIPNKVCQYISKLPGCKNANCGFNDAILAPLWKRSKRFL